MNAAAASAIALAAVPCGMCCLMSGAMDAPSAYTVGEAIRAEARGALGIVLAVMVAGVVGVLSALAGRYARRAATPLPAPPADPLATYREGGPPECPQHPFVR
jgi:hypothetical protein